MRDEDRPPVLAHERFVAARARLADLPIAARFADIHATNLWGAETSVSGLGSEDGATAALRAALPALLRELSVATLLDAPCGDAGWIAAIDLAGIDYIGADIVPAIVATNLAEHGHLGRFVIADITRDTLPPADAILCRDCLVHLSFANIARAVANFHASGAQWLLTTTFGKLQRNVDCEDGDWRGLNFARAPFDWPAPHRLIDECCTEAGGGWRDKSLGAWEIAALPR